MDICLVNPPSPFLVRQDVFPPLGLFYIAEYARQVGNVTVVDVGLGDDIPYADAYGITCNITQADWVAENAPKLAQRAYVVIGGPHATSCPSELASVSDCVVRGDAEFHVADIFLKRPRGIFQSEYYSADDLRFPARDLGRAARYYYYLAGRRATSIVTSRGCPMHCAFCCRIQPFEKAKVRSALSIAREVDHVVGLGFRAVMFYDDMFHLNKKRTKEICDELRHRDIKWKCFCRTNNMSEEVLEWMAEAGCTEISYGIESGSQRILDIIGKETSVAHNLRVIQLTNAAGIDTRCFIIIGLPGESWESIEETKRFLRAAKPTSCGVGIFMPYPSSPIWQHPERFEITFHLEQSKMRDFWYRGNVGSYRSYVSTPYLSREEITEAHRLLTAEFERLDEYSQKHWKHDVSLVSQAMLVR